MEATADAPSTVPGRRDLAAVFYGQLSGLLKAGMPMPEALRTLARDAGARKFREALERAAAEIERGADPTEAFKKEEAELGGILAQVAGAAAHSGRLPALLAELSAWTLAQDRIRGRILDALGYPYLVLLIGSLIGVALLTLVEFFALGEISMDIATDLQVGESTLVELNPLLHGLCWVVHAGALVLALLVPLSALACRYVRALRVLRERLLIWLPAAGAICRSLALSRFCSSVSILLKAGIPLHKAVAAAGRLTGYAPYEAATARMSESIAQGHGLEQAVSDDGLFPGSLRFIIKAAHARGDLPEAFAELASMYELEADGRARVLAVVLPPLCLIGIGLMVVLLMAWLLGPLYLMLNIFTRF